MDPTRRPQQSPPRRDRAGTSWGWYPRLATLIVGVVASLGLLGWVGWWTLTTSLTASSFPLPGVIATAIALLWSGGSLMVVARPGLACGLFLAAGMAVLSAAPVLPVVALLLAVSGGLTAWALLGWFADEVQPGRRGVLGERPLVRRLRRRAASWQITKPRPRCLICQLAAADADGYCADCGPWVRAHPEQWSQAGMTPPVPITTAGPDVRPHRDPAPPARPTTVSPPGPGVLGPMEPDATHGMDRP